MKARIVPLDSDEHDRAQSLLPWFVNGTLGAGEAAEVSAHVARCSRCRMDAEEQSRLCAMGFAAEASGDIDRDWAVLRSRLDAEPVERPAARAAAPRRWWWMRLEVAVALQAAIIFVLVGALLVLVPRSEPYRAMGAAPAQVTPDAVVVFARDATSAQVGAALRAADAHIVGGPTVTGAYLLRLGNSGPAALARLRSQPGVDGAESLQGEPVK